MSWKDKLPSSFNEDYQFAEGDVPSAHAREMLADMKANDVPFEYLETFIAKYLMVKGQSKQDVDAQVARAREIDASLGGGD